ncbi:coiled-coil domain-containing protein 15 [Rhinopithecus roxellana]|uniref:coiled-coil domain-containing protein 15 n=1 Tax=Rhinopithecus roxellana TaxID=61622 RepID=UPI0012371418|nr:coiled-coil domain-containing protein 15 [Rhinopithecus roxellana]
MLGSMAPKKPRNTTRLPLALNPLKSKDVLAVLAERNQAMVPVGAWVEPASPGSSEIPAHTSAYLIEEELKEQLRRKQEALKHFQKQVKYRVNQQIRLRKKQQLQKSYERAEKEGSIAMQSSAAHLTSKRTSVFPNNLNVAIGSSRLPPSLMPGDGIEDEENQNELFQQQAQALSQTVKQARHRLASFKTVSKKKGSVFPDDGRKSFPTREELDCEEPDYEESSSLVTDEKVKEDLFGRDQQDQQDILSEDKNKPFGRVQKVKFKNPLFVLMEDEEQNQIHFEGLQDILPEAQDYFPEAQDQNILLKYQDQDFLPRHQHVLPKDQDILPKYQDQDFLPKDQDFLCRDRHVLPKDWNILPKRQDQDFLPRDQGYLPKDQNILLICQDRDFLPRDLHVLSNDQNILSKCQDQDFLPKYQKADLKQPTSILIDRRGREALPLDVHQDLLCMHHQASIRGKKVHFEEPYSDMTDEKGREDFSLADYQCLPPKSQDQDGIINQQPASFMREERVREELPLDYHQYVVPKIQDQDSPREQNKHIKLPSSFEKWEIARGNITGVPSAYDGYQSGLSTEFQAPLAFQSGVDKEEDKKERQKQYLRHRRLFMDIEREQVKEQQRQKEQKKKIEKIKKKREQERYAEEQRILRMNFHEDPYSGEKMSEILAQLQLEEIKGAREKQQQREKEYLRYVEALRAQIQEKMQLYNITLPPLCCCGPDFWDAHPDTCANNCIFYKNHRAYTRALHSFINSCDVPGGNSTLRVAIHSFASAHRRTLKNL